MVSMKSLALLGAALAASFLVMTSQLPGQSLAADHVAATLPRSRLLQEMAGPWPGAVPLVVDAPPAAEAAVGALAGELLVPGPEGEPTPAAALLFAAVASGNVATLQRLFAAGASTDVRNPAGATALLVAIQEDSAAATNAILDKGADTNLASADGVTPLFLALRKGDIPLATRLLSAGADINFMNAAGETPLTEALNQKPPNYEAIRLLLSRTASPTTSAPDLAAATPVALATGDPQLIALFGTTPAPEMEAILVLPTPPAAEPAALAAPSIAPPEPNAPGEPVAAAASP